MSALNLLVLAHLTGDARMFESIDRTLKMVGPALGHAARAMPMMMAALSTYHAGVRQVVVVGPGQSPDTLDLLRECAATYQPFGIVVPVEPGPPQERLARLLPFIGSLEMREGRATAYVCTNFVCEQPASDPDALRRQLR